MGEPFEPKIIGFLCNWCSYEAADSAGRARTGYPDNLKILRIPCTGRVDPAFVMEAFKEGADGVLILGCPLGQCHYKEGNYRSLGRTLLLKNLLDQIGVDRDRLKLQWVAAGEREQFVASVSEMVGELKQMGPLGKPVAGPGKQFDEK